MPNPWQCDWTENIIVKCYQADLPISVPSPDIMNLIGDSLVVLLINIFLDTKQYKSNA